MIVYSDLLFASFLVLLLLASMFALGGASKSYEQAVQKQEDASVKLYYLFASCSQGPCLAALQQEFAAGGANITITPSDMAVTLGK